MKHLNKDIGDYGEDITTKYLIKSNYKIVMRNFRCRLGEIDIIAFDGDYLCFIEVKTRYGGEFGFPVDAVNRRKQIKIQKVAEVYIYEKNCYNCSFRFDVVEVVLNNTDNDYNVRLIKNAFMT